MYAIRSYYAGINDGSAAIIMASEEAVKRFSLIPKAKILGAQSAGVPPRVMGVITSYSIHYTKLYDKFG